MQIRSLVYMNFMEKKYPRALQSTKIKFAIVICIVAVGVLAYRAFESYRSMTASSEAASALIDQARAAPKPASDRLIYSLQQRLRAKPDDGQSLAYLGNAYLQKVRETGDPSYYAKAEQALKEAVDNDPQNAEALSGMGALCLARHEFQDALKWGKRAVEANPYKAAAFGVIGDAQIELGQYDEAVATIQKMVNLRPDLSSYSRVSYIRELMGDVPGAIEAMKLAVTAGGPALENTNWCRVQLGFLYFNSGWFDEAEIEFQKTLVITPDYAPALFGIARARASQDKRDEAIAILQNVVTTMPLPEYVIELGDLYDATGDSIQAAQQYDLAKALHELQQDNGVQTDAELALFLADHDLDLPNALKHARAAFELRPSIYAADVLAWTLYKNAEYKEAAEYSQNALQLNTKNALFYFHAGMISASLGETLKAQEFLRTALDINPHFSIRHAKTARKILEELKPPIAASEVTRQDAN
jgi:tetratricopeptide (TPR) repeat protein